MRAFKDALTRECAMPFRSFATLLLTASLAGGAEVPTLDATNYERLVPAGKEVDAIYGDRVLRNDKIAAVIATPGEERDANLTVRHVSGSIIDLAILSAPSDQLSCFYPGGGGFDLRDTIDWQAAQWGQSQGQTLAFAGPAAVPKGSPLRLQVGYELRIGEPFVRVASTVTNAGDEPYDFLPADGIRADGDTFKFGVDHEANLWWAYDRHWRQAYGLQPEDGRHEINRKRTRNRRRPKQVIYPTDREAEEPVTLEPGQSYTWKRRLFPAASNVALQTQAYRNREVWLYTATVEVLDGDQPVVGASVRVIRTPKGGAKGEQTSLGVGLTDAEGRFSFDLPMGDYLARVTAQGHQSARATLVLPTRGETKLTLSPAAYAEGRITNGRGEPIPAKVQIIGQGETKSPNFGPESAVHGVKNLQYTADGTLRCKLLPGSYKWIASYGPEHDAAYGEFTVAGGQTAKVEASLAHTVDTTGWLSSELHSHSSPSGDNTASQRGRVLNLLAEHLEFCPCTEHQRIDVYDEHLAHFDAGHRMLTCAGMELTGSPLPLNHQNAFPLIHKPHEQDGGGPQTDPNPVTQIERLAGWDDNSEKLIQTNHPDLAQMIGDRDQDDTPDGGFEKMFGFMDVLEIHPPELIFNAIDPNDTGNSGVGTGGWEGRGNSIVNWLQMLNLGYRVTGVVNTDAHYNFHGSGWMRNWVRSSNDNPSQVSVAELVHEFEHGHVVMSNGPFLSVEATSNQSTAIPGDDLAAQDGKAAVRVVVRVPNWIEINRVQFFLNGRPSAEHNYTIRSHSDWFSDGPEVFNREIEIEVDEDTHLVVACCGEGRSLRSMFGGDELDQDWGRNLPVAVANPIFLDTNGDADGDGIVFEPNGDGLGLPLPTPDDLKPSHGHDHANHTH